MFVLMKEDYEYLSECRVVKTGTGSRLGDYNLSGLVRGCTPAEKEF